ncbi:MAG: efflux RND transporter permease subunit [Immundisolibacter sp.]|uniref:efflux RND transporter permease subunit n=1 Tax=Immundisolibacter sp. TaxID=1934948 RepID=UPI0019B0EF12|nr:efflux RND transporter permease subunit [Immundisolibacter sp.]MBC7162571.1 efflux RND transporter permease subunit [Immundisolibacter sp.]
MKLTDVSVERPVLATVMSLVILLLGVIAFSRLSVREYPMIDTPVVSVRTIYRGASAEIIESQVSQPMEDELSGIEGIDVMKSVSREEVSEITIKFRLTRDPDDAAADVRDRVARARDKLPEDINEPVISKVEADADPIMWLAFFSDRHSPLEVSDFADRVVRDRLQTIPGVATVLIGGERRYSMRIWLDRERLAGYGLTPLDVETALRRENIEVPSGRIESTEREFTVLSETDLRTPAQFDEMIIREVNGYPVRLKDVGHAALGAEDERSSNRVDGAPAVGLGVVKQSTANLLEVARAVKAMLPEIQATLPAGMQFKIGTDRSNFVEESIKAVYRTLFEALVLVVVVIFGFLRSPRATLIPFLSIPVAIIGAFFFLYALDFSINILTLLALVLAIGLVVDDAIVVLENIYRRIEDGLSPREAALVGGREIGFAVLAMTITLVAVFVPMAFQTGTTGRLFREFALAVAGAVAVSGFVALTLVPMLCGRFLKPAHHSPAYQFTERFFVALNRGYEATLRLALRGWVLVLALAIGVGAAGAWMFTQLKSELAPFEDRSDFVVLMIGPEGASYDYMYRNVLEAEKILTGIPEMTTLFMVVSPGVQRPAPVNIGAAFATIKPWGERTRSQFDITRELGPKLGAMPGVLAFPINRASLGMGGYRETPVQFVLQADTWEQLQVAVDTLMARASQNPALLNLDTDLKLNKPQLKVDVNRDKLANVGISAADVGRTLETLLGGREVTRFKRAGKQYEVIVKLADDARRQPTDLTDIYLRAGDGSLVQVDNLVSLREAVAPRELNHFNRLRAAKISANIAPGHAMGEVLDWLAAEAQQVLPPGGRIDYDGISREFKEASQALALTFGLALAFIYLVLSAQFESFRDPLVILLSVPLAVAGAVAALYFSGLTLNVYSQIGMVMLIGLTAKNGILIVEFTRQLRAGGMAARDALVQASVLRLRPILMTSATMLLAAVPLALAGGAGAESRHPIGWVVIGGLLVGTLFSLYVVPVVYLLLSGREAKPKAAAQPLPHPA